MFQTVVFCSGARRSCQPGSEKEWCVELGAMWMSQIPGSENPVRNQAAGSSTMATNDRATPARKNLVLPPYPVLWSCVEQIPIEQTPKCQVLCTSLPRGLILEPYTCNFTHVCSFRDFGTGLSGCTPATESTLEGKIREGQQQYPPH